jgi:hypothetical protein
MATSDVKEDPDAEEGDHETRATVRHERQRDPGQRSEAENRREVDRGLPAHERGDPRGEPLPERILAPDREAQACVGEGAIPGDEDGGADEPELLADDGEDHVGVRFRQVVDLLDPLAEPAAEDPA